MSGSGSVLLEALGVLYGPISSGVSGSSMPTPSTSTPQQMKYADRFLSKWQHSLEAWDGAMELIASESFPQAYRLFGAQTLRKKLTFDASQLELPQLQVLLDALARTPSGVSATRAFWIQIALCLSRLSLILKAEEFSFALMIQMLQKIDTSGILVQEFLTLFPDALTQGSMNTEEKNRAEMLIDENLEVLFSYFSNPQNMEEETIKVRCLFNWIKYADPSRILSLVSQSGLIETFAMVMSRNEDASEVISDLFTELMSIINFQGDMAMYERMVKALVSILSNIPWRSEDEQDTIAFSVGLVLVDVLEAFLGYFFSGQTLSPELMNDILVLWEEGIFKGILEAKPSSLRMADLTIQLWSTMSRNISLSFKNNQQKGTINELDEIKKEKFSFIKNLASRAWVDLVIILQWPSKEVTRQQIDDFRSFRHVIGDSLKDLISIFDKEEIKALFSLTPLPIFADSSKDMFLNTSSPNISFDITTGSFISSNTTITAPLGFDWKSAKVMNFSMNEKYVEAILTAARFIAECVDDFEDEPVLGMMKALPGLLHTYPTSERLWYASILFISAFAPWTAKRKTLVTFQMEILFSVLRNDKKVRLCDKEEASSDLISASSLALESLIIALVSLNSSETQVLDRETSVENEARFIQDKLSDKESFKKQGVKSYLKHGSIMLDAEDVQKWIGFIYSLYQIHPTSERIFSALAHLACYSNSTLQIASGILSMLWKEESILPMSKLNNIEVLLSILADRIQKGFIQVSNVNSTAVQEHEYLQDMAQQSLAYVGILLGTYLPNQSKENITLVCTKVAIVFKGMLMYAISIPQSAVSLALIEAISSAILSSLDIGICNVGPFIRLSNSFIRRVAASRGSMDPSILSFVTAMHTKLLVNGEDIWQRIDEEAMEAYMIFIRSLLEYVPESVIGDTVHGASMISNICVSGRLCERISYWLSSRPGYDPYVIHECIQVFSDIFYTILDADPSSQLKTSLLFYLSGSVTLMILKTLVKCIFCSFPYELIPDISRLVFLILEACGNDHTRDLQAIICDSISSFSENEFSQFEVQNLVREISLVFTHSPDSKRAGRLTDLLRYIYKSYNRRSVNERESPY